MFFLDRLATDHIHRSTHTGGKFEYVMAVFGVSFNNEIVAFLYALCLCFLNHSIENLVLFTLLSPVGLLITVVMKKSISRPRPHLFPPRAEALIFDLRGKEKNHSMPSGDSMQASIFWVTMSYFGMVPLWISCLMIFLTMISRVYYMCHYPSDTIIGAFIGYSVFYVLKGIILGS